MRLNNKDSVIHKIETIYYERMKNSTPSYLRGLFDIRSTGCNLRNLENALFLLQPRTNYGNCGMSCLKVYEPYVLLLNLKEKIVSCSLHHTDSRTAIL